MQVYKHAFVSEYSLFMVSFNKYYAHLMEYHVLFFILKNTLDIARHVLAVKRHP